MNKGKRMRVCVADNDGFSLIELIVCIADYCNYFPYGCCIYEYNFIFI